ncbi:type II toxin-antitoxin system HicB family antitoxin [Candidatus Parcubacteria bacterium]|nr:type II toxin-antitoxin system HicB family antitoxin [Candidatus Parcubacteria bacterium]
MKNINFPFPIFITKEGKWFVAECSVLDIASQGRTEKEAKEMIKDLIKQYLKDPDTPKEKIKEIAPFSMAYLPIKVPTEFIYGKITTIGSK